MKPKSLGEARRLFQARRFPEVIRILEPEVFRHRESFEYFFLLGFSCLQAGDLGGASSYLGRAQQLKGGDTNVLLGLAALHFRKGENESALRRWLEVLEQDPSNRVARRGMDLLKKGPSPGELQEYRESGKDRQLVPDLRRRIPATTILIVALAVLLVVAAITVGLRLRKTAFAERPGVSAVEIPPDLPRLIDAGGASANALSEGDVRQGFSRAKRYLLAYRDNLAAVEINRILLSNAALAVKERASMLKGFIMEPSFASLRDSFPYKVVASAPALYDGCFVSWKGKIANLKMGRESTSLDLLVGYEEEKELEGMVPVTLSFAATLENGAALETLGRIVVQDGKISLLGVSLHRLSIR
jgi:hypothetical protein